MMKTIRGRITFWAIFVLLLSITAVSLFDIFYLGRKLFKERQEALQDHAYKYAEEINTQFMRIIGMADGVSSALIATGIENDEVTQRTLDEFYHNNPELLNVYIGTESGNFHQANYAKMADDYDPRQRDWYIKAANSDDIVVINPYVDMTTGQMTSSVAKAIYDGDKLVGVVAIDVSIDTISDLVSSINYEDNAYGFLIDSEGYVVSHREESFNPTPEGKTKVSDVWPAVDQLMEAANNYVLEHKNYEGINSYYASAIVEGCGWYMGISCEKATFTADIYSSFWVSGLIGAVAAFISLVACLVMIKYEFAPINKMRPAIERICRGDFSEHLDFSTKDDELGILQNDLSNLVGLLNDIIAQQKFILGEISQGNLTVADMDPLPGELNDIAVSVNQIKATLNDLISDIQYSAINLQSTAMGFTGSADPDEMNAIFRELSQEANDLMEKTNRFITKRS